MGLNFSEVRSLPSGAISPGAFFTSVRTFTGQPQPKRGDFLIVNISLQFGLTTPLPSPPKTTFFDDAGNSYVLFGQNFVSQNSTASFIGQFSIDTWICYATNGNPINQFTIIYGGVPDAFNVQGQFAYSDWQLQNQGVFSYIKKVINTNTLAPSVDPISLTHDQLLLACFFSGTVGSDIVDLVTLQPGYSLCNGDNILPQYLEEYIVRPIPLTQSPGIVASSALNPAIGIKPWIMTTLVMSINPPYQLTNTISLPLVNMPIEDEDEN